MKRITIYTGILLLVTASAAIYGFNTNKQAAPVLQASAPKQEMAHSPLHTLQAVNAASLVKLPAEIIADKQASLHAKVMAYVKIIHADIGTRVKKGDLLIELDAPEITAQLSSLRAKIEVLQAQVQLSQSNYARLHGASLTQGAVSELALDELKTKMETDRAALKVTEADYLQVQSMAAYLTITAPFDGIITQRTADVGNLVGPATAMAGQPLLTLQDNENLRLQFSLSQKYAAALHVGDTLHFTVTSLGATPFSTVVTRKSGALDIRLRSEQVEADIVNTNGLFMPGMVADVQINIAQSITTFMVPKTAVITTAKGAHVTLATNGEHQNIPVTVGREQGMMVEITATASTGDTILRQGK
ncbi:MAG: efflux RND transporter periplasmic adaptor subunit [Marinifilaceae bacterium]